MGDKKRTNNDDFDVFLCHNSKDKEAVKEIGEKLIERGIQPWLDEWEVPAGQSWLYEIENQIESIASAAIFLGPNGRGPWQNREIKAILIEFSDSNKPLIPVLLSGSKKPVKVPLFLKEYQWVDFNKTDPDSLERLVRGIRKEKSRPVSTATTLPTYRQTDRISLTGAERTEVGKNRKKDIDEIQQLLERKERGIFISGVKGVGKSTIAAWFLEREDFWLDFRGKTIDLYTLLLLFAQWLKDEKFEKHLNDAKEVGDQEVNYICERLLDYGRHIFFDNLETLLETESRRFSDPEVSQFFERLFSTAHGCTTLITSRIVPVMNSGGELVHLDGISHVPLIGLADDDGAALLRERDVPEKKEGELEEISRAVNGNPLILKILPTLIEPWDEGVALEKITEWKKKYHGDLLASGVLDEAAGKGRILIDTMSVVPDALSKKNIARLCTDIDCNRWVGELHRRSLLEWDQESKLFYLHPAIAETAFEDLAKRPDELADARRRAVGMYLKAGPGIGTKDKWKSIDDCQHLIRAAELMIELGDFEGASNITCGLVETLFRWGHWRLLVGLYKDLFDLWNFLDERSEDLLGHYGAVLGNYGIMLKNLGDFDRAIEFHQKDLAIAKEIDDVAGEGAAYGNLGNAHNSKGDFDRAIEFHQKRLAIAKQIGDVAGEGRACGNLGNAYRSKGNFDRAIEFHRKDLAIAQQIGDVAGEGRAYGNLGNAHNSKGDFDRAIEFHQKALTICQLIGDVAGEGADYGNLGIAYRNQGDFDRAIEFYWKHLAIAQQIGIVAEEGQAYGNLGNAYYSKGDYERAIKEYKKAIEISERIGAMQDIALWNYNIANSYLELDQLENAAYHSLRGLLVALQLQLYNVEDYEHLAMKVRGRMSSEAFDKVIKEKFNEEETQGITKIIEEMEAKQDGKVSR